MAAPVSYQVLATDGEARRGRITTPHGTVETPAFMPVGTRAAVKTLDVRDLAETGAQMMLSNTYHLMLRPGAELVERMGGLHRFTAWEGPILTDSGGYQIFSLDPEVDEQGARFRSVYDGSAVTLTPEDAVRVQEQLGPDIAMALDVCIGLPAPREEAEEAMERTLRWLERATAARTRPDQALFGIVQGGVDPDLRAESARRTAQLPVDGFGIGGLSVGEPAEERNRAVEATAAHLPAGAVRYVMGLGDLEGMLDSIARGTDLFDCVWPTRLARHGKVITRRGDYGIRGAAYAADERPLDGECSCAVCRTHTRAYLRHLAAAKEPGVQRLLSVHNLTVTQKLLADAREAIERGDFQRFRRGVARSRAPAPGGDSQVKIGVG